MITLHAAGGLAPRAVLIYCSCIASVQTPYRLTRLRPLAAIAAGVCVWLTTGAAWPGPALVSAAPRVVAPIRPSLPAPAAFRLGTAAGFLGWSTAIGDFNTDGMPDAAIADRVPEPIDGASYRIEFSVSGREPATVAFDSEQDALTVRLSDVDHDNDLDVVVSGALSRQVVGIWLNDGRGGFSPSDARPFASEIGQPHSLGPGDPSDDTSYLGLTPDAAAGLPPGVRWTPAIPRRSPVNIQSTRLQPAILSSALSSRAPPHSAWSSPNS
jgi:hypothetical protein